jgi:flagellar protein FlgJ
MSDFVTAASGIATEVGMQSLQQQRYTAFEAKTDSMEKNRDDRVKLEAACAEMESLFIHQLMSEMRKTIPKSGLIDGGMAEEFYTSMLDTEISRAAAMSGGLGLSRQLVASFELRENEKP